VPVSVWVKIAVPTAKDATARWIVAASIAVLGAKEEIVAGRANALLKTCLNWVWIRRSNRNTAKSCAWRQATSVSRTRKTGRVLMLPGDRKRNKGSACGGGHGHHPLQLLPLRLPPSPTPGQTQPSVGAKFLRTKRTRTLSGCA
jgi:hypothetical protein